MNSEPDPQDFATAFNSAARAKKLDEMNQRYAVVIDGGRVRVLSFDHHSRERVGHAVYVRYIPSFMTFADFANLHMNQSINVNNNGKRMPLSEHGGSSSRAV